MTLTEFLLARIAEDEAAARDRMMEIAPLRGGCRGMGCLRRADQPHAFGCPARVLAECEAKRRIVEGRPGIPHPPDGCDGSCDGPNDHWHLVDEWDALRALATVYADHPGFKEDWRA